VERKETSTFDMAREENLTDKSLNNWQHGEEHDFTLAQEIIAKTAKLSARHAHLCSLVPKLTPDTEPEILLLLAEADRCVKAILALMEEMEGLFEKSLFQRQSG
jgi:hypothetical protein